MRALEPGVSPIPVPAPAPVEPLLDGVEALALGGTVEPLIEPLPPGVVLLLGAALLPGAALELEAAVLKLEVVVLGAAALPPPPLEGIPISSNLLSKLLLLLL